MYIYIYKYILYIYIYYTYIYICTYTTYLQDLDVTVKLFKWLFENFSENQTKGECSIKSSDYEKILAIKIDSKSQFEDQVQDLYKKANKKVRELA